jgi:hypothetical protein
MPCASFSMLDSPGAHGIEKLLHSEVNLLIQHIIVQDQDGQKNNNLSFSFGQLISETFMFWHIYSVHVNSQ